MTRHADVAASGEGQAPSRPWPTWPLALATGRCARGTLGARGQQRPCRLLPQRGAGPGATVITNRREIAATTSLWACTPPRWTRARSSPLSASHPEARRLQVQAACLALRWWACLWRSLMRVCVCGCDGASSCVFRHAGLEAALSGSFTPGRAAAVVIDASDLNADLHASAAYRANLISRANPARVAKMTSPERYAARRCHSGRAPGCPGPLHGGLRPAPVSKGVY